MMGKMKIENWNGYNIRFIEKDGEWWAVLKDVCEALGIKTKHTKARLKDEVVSTDHIKDEAGRLQEMLIVNEFGIYDTVFQSRKKEAKEFRYWVYEMLKTLREKSGLEGFEVFRMLDKEHQKEAMKKLHIGIEEPTKVDYIKANTIANKAVSNKHGCEKLIKKDNMTPQMMKDRASILEDVVELMCINDKYNLGLSVSDRIYEKYQ